MTQPEPYDYRPREAANRLGVLSEKMRDYLDPEDVNEMLALSQRFERHFADFETHLWEVSQYAQRFFR